MFNEEFAKSTHAEKLEIEKVDFDERKEER